MRLPFRPAPARSLTSALVENHRYHAHGVSRVSSVSKRRDCHRLECVPGDLRCGSWAHGLSTCQTTIFSHRCNTLVSKTGTHIEHDTPSDSVNLVGSRHSRILGCSPPARNCTTRAHGCHSAHLRVWNVASSAACQLDTCDRHISVCSRNTGALPARDPQIQRGAVLSPIPHPQRPI